MSRLFLEKEKRLILKSVVIEQYPELKSFLLNLR
jgi:hypothetical protein